MTDKELDQYFIQTLKNALELFNESLDHEKKYTDDASDNNQEYYGQIISSIETICKKVKTIDDLADMDEDIITDAFDAITAYAEAFVISSDEEQRKKDLEEYEKLEELLYIFCDADEEDEE